MESEQAAWSVNGSVAVLEVGGVSVPELFVLS